jgi:hypothetical protein
MTDRSHPDRPHHVGHGADPGTTRRDPGDPGDDGRIDDLARRAGAEVRRPAPAGFVDGVRSARRRQQTVRAGAGVVGVAALLAVGAVIVRGTTDDATIAPATVPDSVPDTQADAEPDTDPPGETTPGTDPITTVPEESGAGSSTFVPAGTDVDGVPDAIYVPADVALAEENVLDPVALELLETRPIIRTRSGEVLISTSASGRVTYVYPFESQDDQDACHQMPSADWVTGADTTGLPEWVLDITLSADGRVGAAVAVSCPSDAEPSIDGTTGPYAVTVFRFDADDPTAPAVPVLVVDGGAEFFFRASLTDDGSFVMLETYPLPLAEGNLVITRMADTGTGELVTELRDGRASGLPHADCGFGFVAIRLVGNSGLGYVAICPDEGLVVVVRDLVTGETVEAVNAEYVGRTDETMPNAMFEIDRATYTTPGGAWYLLCVEREVDGVIGPSGSRPCWIGRGAEPMREIPSTMGTLASFEPLIG